MVENMIESIDIVTVNDMTTYNLVIYTVYALVTLFMLNAVFKLNGSIKNTNKEVMMDMDTNSRGKRQNLIIRNWFIFAVTTMALTTSLLYALDLNKETQVAENEKKVIEYLQEHEKELAEYRELEPYDSELKELLATYKKYTKAVGLDNNEDILSSIKE